MSRCLQSQESVVGSSHTARPPASVSSSCRQDNKSVTTPKTRPAASAVIQAKAQGIFVEVLSSPVSKHLLEVQRPGALSFRFASYRVVMPPLTGMRKLYFMFLFGET
jgi:hypothetical protein